MDVADVAVNPRRDSRDYLVLPLFDGGGVGVGCWRLAVAVGPRPTVLLLSGYG